MAQQVSIFCSKTKLKPPTVEFEQAAASQEPSCTCTVTLHAYFDADNDGFPEMTFQGTSRTKKASKHAAMTKALEFLSSNAAYKKVNAVQVSGMYIGAPGDYLSAAQVAPLLCRRLLR